jgi:hypothetical protein
VVEASSGTPIRAFVVSYSVDITPVSEVAVRLVLERVAAAPENTLSNYTAQEVDDVVASLYLANLVNGGTTGLELEEAMGKVRDDALADHNLVRFLDAATESGQTSEGPGDIGNFFPMTTGNVWRFRGTTSPGAQDYVASVAVSGPKMVNGTDSHVFLTTDSAITGYTEQYRREDSRGVTFQGDNGPPDLLTSSILPFQEFRFPLKRGDTVVQFDRRDIDLGDFDEDGKSEKGTAKSQVTVEGFEGVNVTAGYFANTAKITTDTLFTITGSASGIVVSYNVTASEWFVSGIGRVKLNVTVLVRSGAQRSSETQEEEELIGMVLDGHSQQASAQRLSSPGSIRSKALPGFPVIPRWPPLTRTGSPPRWGRERRSFLRSKTVGSATRALCSWRIPRP